MGYEILTFVGTPFESNCYVLVEEGGNAVTIDPNERIPEIVAAIRERGSRLVFILNTHGHCDHVSGNAALVSATGATLAIHELETPMLEDALLNGSALFGFSYQPAEAERLLRDGDEIVAGTIRLIVFHTPGHSPGSVCYYDEFNNRLFSGDLLFQGSVGRTDLPGGNHAVLMRSLREKILPLPDNTLVFPGHGPTTTIGVERHTNPFLRMEE